MANKTEVSYEIFTDENCTFGKRIAYQKVESIPSTFSDIRKNAKLFEKRVLRGQLKPVRPDWSTEQLRNAEPIPAGTTSDADAVYHVVPVYLRMKVTNGSERAGAASAEDDLDALFGELPETSGNDLGF